MKTVVLIADLTIAMMSGVMTTNASSHRGPGDVAVGLSRRSARRAERWGMCEVVESPSHSRVSNWRSIAAGFGSRNEVPDADSQIGATNSRMWRTARSRWTGLDHASTGGGTSTGRAQNKANGRINKTQGGS